RGVHVLCVAARAPTDAAAARWLARVLERGGAHAECTSSQALGSEIVTRGIDEAPEGGCGTALTPAARPHARLICARLRQPPGPTEVVVGLWAAPEHERTHRAAASAPPCIHFFAAAGELFQLVRGVSARISSGAGGASSRRGWEGGGERGTSAALDD